MRFKSLLVVLTVLSATSAFATDIATRQLLLRGVDKITGRVNTMTATIDQPLQFGALTIIADRCLTKPQEETPENAAYLRVYESTGDNPSKEVFKGWMFSSNPALSAMEHPIYDIWVLNCINKDITENPVLPSLISREDDLNLVADDDNPALSADE